VIVANRAMAESLLDWRPRHRDIDEIVATAWRWHAERNGAA
jgi:UDP-glucose 4-epimerase